MNGNLLSLAAPRSTPNAPGYAKLVDQNWVDLRMFKKCKSICARSHQTCNDWPLAKYLKGTRPQFLVDTWCQSLVPAPPSAEYVALSYIWGDSQSVRVNESILEQLFRPQALSEDSICGSIPKTIRHAIALTALLGERYLWVDALCIVQDNDSMKHSELSRMSGIYANAALTIIAAAGPNADYGIPGIRGVSRSREAGQKVYDLGGGSQIIKTPWPSNNPWESSKQFDAAFNLWDSRGWTYQEEAFSRKKLLFYGNSVLWVCAEASQPEFLNPASDALLHYTPSTFYGPHDTMIDFLSAVPDITELGISIMQINSRDLTYPEDALGAFAGLASVFSRQYDGGFVSGLPSLFFNFALLWQSERVQRRKPLVKTSSKPCLPSWSWAGWQGLIRFWSWRELSKHQSIISAVWDGSMGTSLLQHWKDTLTTDIQWYSHEQRDQPGQPIVHKWPQYAKDYIDDIERVVPSGWKRQPIQAYLGQIYDCDHCATENVQYWKLRQTRSSSASCSHDSNNACIDGTLPRCYYTHASSPHKPYLFPLPSPAELEPQPTIEARFISCETKRAVLFGGDVFLEEPLMVSIRDKTGAWVGALNVHRHDLGSNPLAGSGLELAEVAYSQVSHNSDFAKDVFVEWDTDECPKTGSQYKFYYVFWIQWRDGVAYREGLGRVLKNVWESQPKEDVNLFLG
ncbi:putative Heterokaryon incompatibility protein-domain-containing protein [Seiridium cardinale]|uniref:Heterokaryon incompatibility protein-domain-containing protein n=1 Tax=Seiridium cardinale TaxID=138064 RepID=A0ABR2XHB2_9PEZI